MKKQLASLLREFFLSNVLEGELKWISHLKQMKVGSIIEYAQL